MEIFRTIEVMPSLWMGVGRGVEGRQEAICSSFFPWVQNLSCLGVWTFSGIWPFSWIPWYLWTSGGVRDLCSGLAVNQSLGGEKNCILYSMFCVFIIIIIIISSSSIYFFVSLNCLYLNPQVSLLVHFSSPFWWGGKAGVGSNCLVLSCWLPG